MVGGADDDEQVRDEGTDHEAPINHDVGEHDEPAVASSALQLAAGLGASNRPRWIFTTDTNADEETICRECCAHALEAATGSIGAGTESSEDDQGDGGDEKGVGAGPFVAGVSEDQLAEHGADEGERGNVLAGWGIGEGGAIDVAQDGVDGADNLIKRRAWVSCCCNPSDLSLT